MTPAQKLELRRSEVRQRLGELSALEGDAFTDDMRAETDRLAAEYRDLETRHRAALIAGDVAAEDGTTTEAPEGDRERAELRARATLGGYLSAALGGRAPTGAEGELLRGLRWRSGDHPPGAIRRAHRGPSRRGAGRYGQHGAGHRRREPRPDPAR